MGPSCLSGCTRGIPPFASIQQAVSVLTDRMEAHLEVGRVEEAERIRLERVEKSKEGLKELRKHQVVQNWRGECACIADVHLARPSVPVGTGDCCSTKLVALAARKGLRPTGIAEFFFGRRVKERGRMRDETFYEACEARCQPVLGFMLCGLEHM
mmetsp:Transcript_27160/g.53360  ORF Transcript_27160/g.53360 Transcript_27160/m.53360 type:complete len:155 (-) Transcript_27160:43-507(-)